MLLSIYTHLPGTEQVSPTNLVTLLVPMTPPVGSFGKSKAFLVWARKTEHTEHCQGPLAEEPGPELDPASWLPNCSLAPCPSPLLSFAPTQQRQPERQDFPFP